MGNGKAPEWLLPLALLAPAALFLTFFIAIPSVQALQLAFHSSSGSGSLEPFRRMVSDTRFLPALRNTLILIALIIPIQLVLALTMALIAQSRRRGAGFFLYVYAIPLAISELAAGLVWLAIFTERGYLNVILHGLGWIQRPVIFLSYERPLGILLAVVVAEAWRATAIVMVTLVAGLQMILGEYWEAAEVFGANLIQKIRYVVLPLLRPSLQAALIIRTLFAFQTFAVVVALGGGVLPVLASEAYNWYVGAHNPHVAAAYALVILVLSAITTGLYLRLLRVRPEELGR
ncbi:Lactose transport system permease protein LacF [Candidatus Thermoflexus japonica]|uniref:Lactose transport system permease protein LacF n=1 Tax=Candidatus Thermoflexus japonica TaxID=2035417 RepID=A0A2H5Y8C1_9CHLR|nr:Lactose transport system permease protein LacF [Candidatus Thermoflexus japonica]